MAEPPSDNVQTTGIEGIPDQEQYLSSNIEDYLLSLAESLYLVQQELNQMSVPSRPGQPAIAYQLPKLDFELKMSIELAESTTSSGGGRRALSARPISAMTQATQTNAAEAASTIRGSFVAIPAAGGKPPPVVRTFLKRLDPRKWEIKVGIQSAVGQQLEGVEVQFNVDREESKRLSAGESLTIDLSAETNLWYGVVNTDQQGLASNVLVAADTEIDGTLIVVLIDVLSQTESLVFRVESGATQAEEPTTLLQETAETEEPPETPPSS